MYSEFGSTNSYILKLDTSGTFKNIIEFTGIGNNRCFDVAIGESSIYACGSWNGEMDFDPSLLENTVTTTPSTDIDGFLVKINECSLNLLGANIDSFTLDNSIYCSNDHIELNVYGDLNNSELWVLSEDNGETISVLDTSSVGLLTFEFNDSSIYELHSYGSCVENDTSTLINFSIIPTNYDSLILTVCEYYILPSGNDTLTISGIYNDTLVNSFGCDSIIYIDLVVNEASIGTDSITTCSSYTWINGVEYFEDNTTATFLLTNSNGCDSLVTLNLNIDPIDIGVLNNDPTLSAIETDAEYQWLNCLDDFSEILAATFIDFTPEEIGEYAVEVTKLECVDTSDCYIITTVGFEENEPLSEINIYPNPTDGMINMDFGNLKKVQFSIYSTKGDLVYRMNNLGGGLQMFDLQLESGIYFIEIKTSTTVEQFKLILN